jgi:hypothetical protein
VQVDPAYLPHGDVHYRTVQMADGSTLSGPMSDEEYARMLYASEQASDNKARVNQALETGSVPAVNWLGQPGRAFINPLTGQPNFVPDSDPR